MWRLLRRLTSTTRTTPTALVLKDANGCPPNDFKQRAQALREVFLHNLNNMGVACTTQQLAQYIAKVKDARIRASSDSMVYVPPSFLDASWWTEAMFNALDACDLGVLRVMASHTSFFGQVVSQQPHCMGNKQPRFLPLPSNLAFH